MFLFVVVDGFFFVFQADKSKRCVRTEDIYLTNSLKRDHDLLICCLFAIGYVFIYFYFFPASISI